MINYTQPPSSYGPGFSEEIVEEATLAIFASLGYETAHGPDIGPDTAGAERGSYGEVVLRRRLVAAVKRLNPTVPEEARADAIQQVLTTVTPSLIEENRRLHKLITEGVDVEYVDENGVIKGDKVKLIDFEDVDANDWLAVNQFTVIENHHDRRPDVVVFVNGLPLGVIELKNAGSETATLDGAFNQLQTYKAEIPSLFRTNAVLAGR